ncbi:MAG: DUF1800 domain-containing protein [Sphingobacteriales bacterium]|nr:MAG: DUF1800 domain-containing protein [Sphingobacteriales bacterium]
MALSNLQKNLHLLWRAGFGPSLQQLPGLATSTPAQLWQNIVRDSQALPEQIEATMPQVDRAAIAAMDSEAGKKAALQAFRKESRQELQKLSSDWLQTLISGKAQLRERMAFFWHNHFATRVNRVDCNRDLLHVFRTHALGNFGALLTAVSTSPAMLSFLNNQQNRKKHPNENFARELMELFTLGRGPYTETDIKESARAFTGWAYAPTGNGDEVSFVFRKRDHDEGEKIFLGQRGAFDGEDILRILLQQKQTARFITTKIYRYFVNETPDPKQIEVLSQLFYDSNYDISTLLEALFTHVSFFDERNVANRIKSPIDLLVGINRMVPIQYGNPRGLVVLQNVLGQILLYPPNVAGWPMGKAWIDSSSLLLRMQLPFILAGSEPLTVAPKPNDDLQMGQKLPEQNFDQKPAIAPKLLQTRIDWTAWDAVLGQASDAQIASYVLIRPEKAPVALARQAVTGTDQPNQTYQYLLRLMSLPEYQLC